jgi:hypothetical protein
MPSKNKQLKVPKQRNAFVQHARFRSGAGVHQKTNKAKRKNERQQFKKESREFFQIVQKDSFKEFSTHR